MEQLITLRETQLRISIVYKRTGAAMSTALRFFSG